MRETEAGRPPAAASLAASGLGRQRRRPGLPRIGSAVRLPRHTARDTGQSDQSPGARPPAGVRVRPASAQRLRSTVSRRIAERECRRDRVVRFRAATSGRRTRRTVRRQRMSNSYRYSEVTLTKSTTACAKTISRPHWGPHGLPHKHIKDSTTRSMATPRRSHAYAAAARTLLGPPPTSVCEPNGRRSPRRRDAPLAPVESEDRRRRDYTNPLLCPIGAHESIEGVLEPALCPPPSARRMEMGAQPHPSPSDQDPPPNRHPRGRQPRRQRRAHDAPHPHA